MRILQQVTTGLFLLAFAGNVFAQEKKINPKILNDACECIEKINDELPKNQKTDSIKKCIDGAIMADQVKSVFGEDIKKLLEAKSDTTISDKSYAITVDKDYDEIQKALLDECPAVKNLLLNNNQRHKNSVSENKKAREFYSEGEKYFSNGEYEAALVQFNKAVKQDPKFAFAWDNLGICYRKLERYKEAIKCYEKSLELDPQGSVPLGSMATAYELLGDFKKAAEYQLKRTEYYPEDPEGYYGAGRMLFADEQYEKGIDYTCQAYLIYQKTNSPYIHDAESNIAFFYRHLKEKGKLDIFNAVAKKYNIEIK